MPLKLLTIFLALFILFSVIELVRREKLTFKYASGWMFVCVVAVFFAVFDRMLFAASDFFKFELPSNFIFFSLIVSLIFMSLLMTIFLCQQNRRNDKMAQKIGILEFEIDRLKEEGKLKNPKEKNKKTGDARI